MTPSTPQRPWRMLPGVLEILLWLVAAACLGFLLIWAHEAWAARQQSARIAPEREVPGEDTSAPPPAHAGQVVARLDLPAIRLSVPVVEGDDVGSLRHGAGHLAGTAVPGGLGNFVVAAHRDTFFRPLRRIQPGMTAVVTNTSGSWRYVVERTEIVNPDRVDLLGIGDVPEMTLITCYPFNYIGAAPQRFIVHARLVSADEGSPTGTRTP